MKVSSLQVVTARQLLGSPTFSIMEWENFSRRAYVNPLLVRDGYHDYVLMGAPDYVEMQVAHALLDGLSKESRAEMIRLAEFLRNRDGQQQQIDAPEGTADIALLAHALHDRGTDAPFESPAVPDEKFGSPDLDILVPALAEMAKIAAPTCRCNVAGRIICTPHDRC